MSRYKYGRYGDTKIRKVHGEDAHVNENEAALIDRYGKTGEDIVKAIGSGTINPETGLKEYLPKWLTPPKSVRKAFSDPIGAISSGFDYYAGQLGDSADYYGGRIQDRMRIPKLPDWAGGGYDYWGSVLSMLPGNKQFIGDYGESSLRGGKDLRKQFQSATSAAREYPGQIKKYFDPLTDPTRIEEAGQLPDYLGLKPSYDALIEGSLGPLQEDYKQALGEFPQLSEIDPGTEAYTEAIAASALGKPVQERYDTEIAGIEAARAGYAGEAETSAKDIGSQYEQAAVQTGMAHHGGVERSKDVAEEEVTKDFQKQLQQLELREKGVTTGYETDIAGLEKQFKEQYKDPLRNFPSQYSGELFNIEEGFKGLVESGIQGWEDIESQWNYGSAEMPTSGGFIPWLEGIKSTSPWYTKGYEKIAEGLIPEELRG